MVTEKYTEMPSCLSILFKFQYARAPIQPLVILNAQQDNLNVQQRNAYLQDGNAIMMMIVEMGQMKKDVVSINCGKITRFVWRRSIKTSFLARRRSVEGFQRLRDYQS